MNKDRVLLLTVLQGIEDSIGESQVICICTVDDDIRASRSFPDEFQVLFGIPTSDEGLESEFGKGRNTALGASEGYIFIIRVFLLQGDRDSACDVKVFVSDQNKR